MSIVQLSESDVERLLTMPVVVDVMEEAFRQLAAGQADNSPRVRVRARGALLHSMSAAAEYLGMLGWKQYTTTRDGAKFLIGLYDQSTGNLISLIEADRLGQMRTGAVTGLAAKYLATPDASRMGLFGSGWQAEAQLEALHAVRPIQQCFVYSRDASRRSAFAERMSERLNIEVVSADTPAEAVADLPIVVTATTSRVPVFDGSLLAPGALVAATGSNWLEKTEIDTVTVGRAKLVVCDSVECCRREAGDLAQAELAGVFSWNDAVDLAEIVSNQHPGRNTGEGTTVFKSVGMAIEDLALGAKVLELSRAP